MSDHAMIWKLADAGWTVERFTQRGQEVWRATRLGWVRSAPTLEDLARDCERVPPPRQHDPRAGVWNEAQMIAQDLGCCMADALALRETIKGWSWQPDAWSAIVREIGTQRVIQIAQCLPDATPHAVRVALRVPEACESFYFREMAKHIPASWDAIPDDAIRRVLREQPWNTVVPKYRARLIAGESPRAIVADLWEPVDRPIAWRWLVETGGRVMPDAFYAVQIAGLSTADYERLCGYRDRVERVVIDWYARKRASEKMIKERPWRLPDGTTVLIALTALLDEVRPAHLVNGVTTDPDQVFVAVMTAVASHPTGSRIARLVQESEWRATPFPAFRERTPIPGITQVRSWDRLVMIGERERHCAGNYAPTCAIGRTFMFEVNLDGAFSLFRVTPDGALVQHLAGDNTHPIASHRRAVAEWLRRNGVPDDTS